VIDNEMQAVRGEIAATRAQMADTIASLEARVSSKVDGVRRAVDPMEHARNYPWLALAAAVGVGAALSATGRDRRAATAVVGAGKRAPDTVARAARRAYTSAQDAVRSPMDMDALADAAEHGPGGATPRTDRAASRGLLGRLTGPLVDAVDERLATLVQQSWHEAIGATATSPASTATRA
jgi:hypothetical protein